MINIFKSQNTTAQQGFTIVELMMATTVLSVILLLTTVMMLNIGKLYYKGANQAKTQDTTRNIADDIAQHLQLADIAPVPATKGDMKAYCVTTTRYVFRLNKQIGNEAGQSKHVLWRDSNPGGGCSIPDGFLDADVPSKGGAELMGGHMRLSYLNIDTTITPWRVEVSSAFGIDDDMFSGSGMSIACKGGSDTQFCATSHLTTSITKRMVSY